MRDDIDGFLATTVVLAEAAITNCQRGVLGDVVADGQEGIPNEVGAHAKAANETAVVQKPIPGKCGAAADANYWISPIFTTAEVAVGEQSSVEFDAEID